MESVPRSGCVTGQFLLLAAFCFLQGAGPASAWNQPGHMMTASVAYDQMTPAQRAWALQVLEANPSFDKWKEMAPQDAPDFDFGRYVFMMAARWPDDIRKRKDEPDKPGSPYDHPKWHYVDFPLVPPDFPMEPPPTGTEDLFSAYAFSEKMVTAPDTSAVDRAAYLCWLLHLTGDIMQPLHSVALFNATYPDGDKGGNDFFVNLAGNSINLHTYWDGMGAVMMDYPEIIAHATDLEKKFPRSALPELATAKEVHAWALESRQLAIDMVYRRGTLPGTSNKDQTILPPLPGDYATKARALAERRIVLAGDRIADTVARLAH